MSISAKLSQQLERRLSGFRETPAALVVANSRLGIRTDDAIGTAGVEAALQYRFGVSDFDFTLNASGTWVDKLNNFFDPNDLTFVDPELGELQRPEWAGRASLTGEYKGFSLTWGTTYLSEMGLRSVEIESVGNTGTDTFSFANGIADEVFIHDISFSWEASDMIDIYGGVNNVFNRKPFVTEQAYPVSPVGTLFFLGATVSM